MNYISTRAGHAPVSPSQAIMLGMVPGGGLFVPQDIPALDAHATPGSYQDTARSVLAPFLTDMPASRLDAAINGAYNQTTFDTPGIVELVKLDTNRSILELWHGPTAAFKDMALQIMPSLMQESKTAIGDRTHTVVLVATSGDTGKAALEGLRDRPGISIVVFYPADGVSQVQRLQMVTTEGSNTHVIAVRGNFDDCQTGVKMVFGDAVVGRTLRETCGVSLSSANSINWGRLCPQIAYYFHGYALAVAQGSVRNGDPVDFAVPTGNFGNILAGYYARRMGVPIRRLICAANMNNVLADFFATGTYDRKRTFHRTMSPSMDILISSNLERFLFEITGRDVARVGGWFGELDRQGSYTVDDATRRAMGGIITAGWADEETVRRTIRDEFNRSGYVLDTHTAVAAAVHGARGEHDGVHTIITATASPYKFSGDVLCAITGERCENEFRSIDRLHSLGGTAVPCSLRDLDRRMVRHDRVIDVAHMEETVASICAGIQ